MKNIIILLFASLLFCSSCVSESEKVAAANAAAVCGAEDYTVSHVKSTGTVKGTHHALEVKMKHIKSADNDEKLASSSAMNIFGMLTKEDYKDYDQIKIVIERDASTYEKTFDIKNLALTEPLLKNLMTIFRKDENNNYLVPKDLVDSRLIKDSTMLQFANILGKIEEDNGRLSDVSLSGFSYDLLKDMDEDILIAKVNATNGTLVTGYTFYLSLSSKKIIYIGVNDEEK